MEINKHWHFILIIIALYAVSFSIKLSGNESLILGVQAAVGGGLIVTIILWIRFAINKRK